MADLVQLLNENGYLADGVAYNGVWITPTLNRKDLGRLYTLPHVELIYSIAEESTIEVSATPDGGTTFPVVKTVTLPATGQEPEQAGRVAVPLRVTGTDLRVRIRFTTQVPSNIHVYVPALIERGKHFYAVRATESDS